MVHVFKTQCIMALQGHFKVVNFGTNRKHLWDFLLVLILSRPLALLSFPLPSCSLPQFPFPSLPLKSSQQSGERC